MDDNHNFSCLYFSVFGSIHIPKEVENGNRRTREIKTTG